VSVEDDVKQYLIERALDCTRQVEEDVRLRRYVDKIYNSGKRDAYRQALEYVQQLYDEARCSRNRA